MRSRRRMIPAKPHENIALDPVPTQPDDDPRVGKRRTPTGVTMTGADRKSEGNGAIPGETPGILTSKRRAVDGAGGCCVSRNGFFEAGSHCGSCNAGSHRERGHCLSVTAGAARDGQALSDAQTAAK